MCVFFVYRLQRRRRLLLGRGDREIGRSHERRRRIHVAGPGVRAVPRHRPGAEKDAERRVPAVRASAETRGFDSRLRLAPAEAEPGHGVVGRWDRAVGRGHAGRE